MPRARERAVGGLVRRVVDGALTLPDYDAARHEEGHDDELNHVVLVIQLILARRGAGQKSS